MKYGALCFPKLSACKKWRLIFSLLEYPNLKIQFNGFYLFLDLNLFLSVPLINHVCWPLYTHKNDPTAVWSTCHNLCTTEIFPLQFSNNYLVQFWAAGNNQMAVTGQSWTEFHNQWDKIAKQSNTRNWLIAKFTKLMVCHQKVPWTMLYI